MYLLEHDAKVLLARRGIPVPEGRLIANLQELGAAPLPPGPWVVKGQIAAGGRGRAGLVRRAATVAELRTELGAMLGAAARSHRVGAARVETAVSGAHEAYAGFLLDPAGAGVRVILSAQGGVDIERVPRAEIHGELAAPEAAALEASVERLARRLPRELAPAAREAGSRLARAFLGLEALLLEVNPLFVAPGGGWLAGDAKLVTDDNALHRQP
ncbi:MAG TPA: ATP-grasp domain-containing protein, partial [Burkholderiales bacterium]|nr:ATP-grasp domain-containing protein [Burkholderiales bacterium]